MPRIITIADTYTNRTQDGRALTTDLDDVRTANDRAGGNWFSRGALRFFASRLVFTDLVRAGLFVSSERFNDRTPRLYTVRVALAEGSIETVGQFQGHQTRRAALREVERLAAILRDGGTIEIS